ncbi:MAG: hypothetical protein EOP04_17225 [Proteobacteria bacterium]|nr:MAG: hypothetical protein EOP04_17225 [Pseudomonadota bacterium]
MIEFEKLINFFRVQNQLDVEMLSQLIFSSHETEIFEGGNTLTFEPADSKYLIAQKICDAINLKENKTLDKDRGLWTWLSALLLPKLVQHDKFGAVKFSSDDALYLYDPSWKRYYRHLLAFPCLVYSTLGDKGRIFLRGRISERGEIVEQLASVQDVQRNPGVIEAVTLLYYDAIKDTVVNGAASKPNEERNLGGQARRLREVLKQFALTYDLNAMNGSQIVQLLPREFQRWKKNHSTVETSNAIS